MNPLLYTSEPLVDLLARLEQEWRRLAAPIAEALRPGLPAEVAQRTALQADLQLPDELVQWFGWHNGVAAPSPDPRRHVGPAFQLLSLEEALELRSSYLEEAETYDDPDLVWRPSWLPITVSDVPTRLAATCRRPGRSGRLSPVYAVIIDEGEHALVPRAASMAGMVSVWLRAIELGAWELVDGVWSYHPELLPLDLDLTRLV